MLSARRRRKTTRFAKFAAAPGPLLRVIDGLRLAQTLLLRCWPGLRRAPHGFRARAARAQIRRETRGLLPRAFAKRRVSRRSCFWS